MDHDGSMPEVPSMRASDAERTAVSERLRRALDEGRLTVLEYDDRLQAAYAASTVADLVPLTADLPAEPAPAHEVAVPPAQRLAWLTPWRNLLAGNMFFIAIWAISSIASSHLIFFWPGIFLVISGAGIASRQLRGDQGRSGPPPPRPE